MANFIAKLRMVLLFVAPFYLLHLYLVNYYQLSLFDILAWWFKSYSTVDDGWAVIFAFLFTLLLFFLPVTGLINTIYLGVLGEKQTLVYLGNSKQGKSLYYKHGDNSKTVFDGYNVERAYNFSFENLHTLKYFLKDPGASRIVGQKRNRFHPYAILGTIFFIVSFSIMFAAATHALAYPVYQAEYGETAFLHGEAMSAFDTQLTLFYMTREKVTLLAFVCLLSGLYFTVKMPAERTGPKTMPLPHVIRKGNVISGLPVDIRKEFREVRSSGRDNSTTKVDTGFRFVTFEFAEDFNPPVYVTDKFYSRTNPGLEEEITGNISARQAMKVEVEPKLAIKIAGRKDSGDSGEE